MAEPVELLPERDKRVLQLHMDAPHGLEDLADELTEVAMSAVEMARGEDREVVRAALREFLHQHVLAGDVCGLSTFCWGMPLLDPWRARDDMER